MGTKQSARRWRLVAATTLAAIGAALLATLAFAGSSDQPSSADAPRVSACGAATTPASELGTAKLRKTTRCLLNEERAVRGLAQLRREPTLQKPSQQHARAMAANDCLAHRCGSEADLETRIRRAGYLQGVRAWQYAEETGCAFSAGAMVDNWLASNAHRLDILEPKYRELGIGVVGRRVKSRCDKGYATFSLLVGWRRLD